MDDPFPSADDLFPVAAPWAPPDAWSDQWPADGRLGGWLTTAGSLTRALRAACAGPFDLQVHRRTERPLPAAGATLLGLGTGAPVRQREVWLRCAGEAVVFARSWIPDGVMADPGDHPLGDRLFEPGEAERLSLEMAPVEEPGGRRLWARRSLHRTERGRLLVGELFLEGMDAL
jgi:chorismate-pyruvate lyase